MTTIDRNSPLVQAYLFHRRGFAARVSLIMARRDIAAGIKRYAQSPDWRKFAVGTWQSLDSMPRYASLSDRAYYCDDWSDWRLTGRADEVARANDCRRSIDHTGWYTDDDGDCGTLAGYVLQIPARKGTAQYVPGTRHSDYDGVTLYPLDRYDDAMECARAADRYAEIAAESERDYQRASSAGLRASELAETAIAARREILAICRDLRLTRRAIKPDLFTLRDNPHSAYTLTPGSIERLCAIARDKVATLLDRMQEARAERDKLISDYGNQKGFQDI